MNPLIFLTPKDLVIIYGGTRGLTWCQETVREIREAYGMKRRQLLTLGMFCEYMKLPVDEVARKLESGGRK